MVKFFGRFNIPSSLCGMFPGLIDYCRYSRKRRSGKVSQLIIFVYLGYTWKTWESVPATSKLTAVRRRTSTSRRFRRQLAPHFAHRLFVYPQDATVLFAKYSEEL